MPLRYALLTIGRTRSVLGLTGMAALLALAGGFFLLRGADDTEGKNLILVSWSGATAALVLLVSTIGLCMSCATGTKSVACKILATTIYLIMGSLLVQWTRPYPGLLFLVAVACLAMPALRLARIVDWRSVIGRQLIPHTVSRGQVFSFLFWRAIHSTIRDRSTAKQKREDLTPTGLSGDSVPVPQTLHELQLICQKPQWREQGSLLARRFARPAALYITWLVSELPISANAVTGCTLVVGWTAAAFMALPGFFGIGVATLWLWYLLDHVDGQLARLHSSQSVTGVYFDFMMHHLVHPAVAFAIGYGLASSTNCLPWTLAGASFALGTIALSLSNDCRYKAFYAVASRASQPAHPLPDPGAGKEGSKFSESSLGACTPSESPTRLLRLPKSIHACLLRLCEIPNIILALTVLAACSMFDTRLGFRVTEAYVMLMAVIAPLLAVLRLFKQVWRRLPDREIINASLK
jgi:phosphatidylserine synthase